MLGSSTASTYVYHHIPSSLGFAVVAWYGLYMHMRGCKAQGYWSWRKLDKETAMAVTVSQQSVDEEHGWDKDVKVGQSGPAYSVPYQQ